ncbi:MAG: 16S rRNA (cytidine(1402)-2'-O)-methyltransferase [Caldilineae bacterium]|nr:MAG: 16S rRNA (cytidine(1402)-2'-O)-methyltransferase [Caldilineae bacterium]
MATLYLVSTPIGNLEDMTLRGLRVLSEVRLIAAEDTRHSRRLLQHYGISRPLLSLHEHNEQARIDQVLETLDQGHDVALISDAGTPAISDPGFRLVRACLRGGHRVVPVPGASALLAALVASGMPSDRFLFLGFPPRKPAARKQWLSEVKEEPGVLIMYESPRRLPSLLRDIAEVLGPSRPLVVARELTKRYETFWRGSVRDALTVFAEAPRGEVVVLVGGAPKEAPRDLPSPVREVLHDLMLAGISASQAARLVAKLTGLPRRRVYQAALAEAAGKHAEDKQVEPGT